MRTIEFNNRQYPAFQAEGNAARWIMPFAQEICQGRGLDVGYGQEDWKLPDAFGIDPAINGWSAMDLPDGEWDYIFSSHCLEHVDNWVDVLDYWREVTNLIFLYLPHYSQEYWRPWNNRKHIHALSPRILEDYFRAYDWNVKTTGADLNDSFAVVAWRR